LFSRTASKVKIDTETTPEPRVVTGDSRLFIRQPRENRHPADSTRGPGNGKAHTRQSIGLFAGQEPDVPAAATATAAASTSSAAAATVATAAAVAVATSAACTSATVTTQQQPPPPTAATATTSKPPSPQQQQPPQQQQ